MTHGNLSTDPKERAQAIAQQAETSGDSRALKRELNVLEDAPPEIANARFDIMHRVGKLLEGSATTAVVDGFFPREERETYSNKEEGAREHAKRMYGLAGIAYDHGNYEGDKTRVLEKQKLMGIADAKKLPGAPKEGKDMTTVGATAIHIIQTSHFDTPVLERKLSELQGHNDVDDTFFQDVCLQIATVCEEQAPSSPNALEHYELARATYVAMGDQVGAQRMFRLIKQEEGSRKNDAA